MIRIRTSLYVESAHSRGRTRTSVMCSLTDRGKKQPGRAKQVSRREDDHRDHQEVRYASQQCAAHGQNRRQRGLTQINRETTSPWKKTQCEVQIDVEQRHRYQQAQQPQHEMDRHPDRMIADNPERTFLDMPDRGLVSALDPRREPSQEADNDEQQQDGQERRSHRSRVSESNAAARVRRDSQPRRPRSV